MGKEEYNRIVRALLAIEDAHRIRDAKNVAASCLHALGYYDRDETRSWVEMPEDAVLYPQFPRRNHGRKSRFHKVP